jgi:LacI family transcriptional regulator
MPNGISLKVIADKLGISLSTVSRVLNDKPGINEKTRQRVLKAVRELKYSPDNTEINPENSKTKTIGFIRKKRIQKILSEDYHERSITGVEEGLTNSGYHAVTISVTDEEMLDANKILVARERRVDGFILHGPSITPRFIHDLQSMDYPVVLLGNKLRETEIDSIFCENRQSSYNITKHLIGHAHKKIVFLSGPSEWTSNRERSMGYREALEEAGLKPNIINMPDTTFETGKEYFASAMRSDSEITAIVAVNDSTAIGVMDEARKAGVKVPDDLAIVGFDDIAWASIAYPPLSTIHIYLEEMGRLAAFRLLELIDDPESVPVKASVATSMVIRSSCGCELNEAV